jgi:hypothetical protein
MGLTEKQGEIIKRLQDTLTFADEIGDGEQGFRSSKRWMPPALAYFGFWQTKLGPSLAVPGCAIVLRRDRPPAVACKTVTVAPAR